MRGKRRVFYAILILSLCGAALLFTQLSRRGAWAVPPELLEGIPAEALDGSQRQISLAVAVRMLANDSGFFEEEIYAPDSTDAPWYAAPITWAQAIQSLDDTQDPADPLTWDGAVNLLYRYTMFRGPNIDVVSDAAREPLLSPQEWAVKNHIIGDADFIPERPISLLEMAQLLARLQEIRDFVEPRPLFDYSAEAVRKVAFLHYEPARYYEDRAVIEDVVEHLNQFRYDTIHPVNIGWDYRVLLWLDGEEEPQCITLFQTAASVGKYRYGSDTICFPEAWIRQYCS